MLNSLSGAVFQPRRIPAIMKTPFYFLLTTVAAFTFSIAAFPQNDSSVRHVSG